MHETLADVLVDLTQNAIESGASEITVSWCREGSALTLFIGDNGSGMDAETLQRVRDPFYTDGIKHPERRVGLGIPFLIQMVDAVGGDQTIESEPGVGTSLRVSLPADHVDLPPAGDMAQAICTILAFDGAYEMTVIRKNDDREYIVRRSELVDALGELESVGARTLLKSFIESHEESLYERGGHDGQDDS